MKISKYQAALILGVLSIIFSDISKSASISYVYQQNHVLVKTTPYNTVDMKPSNPVKGDISDVFTSYSNTYDLREFSRTYSYDGSKYNVFCCTDWIYIKPTKMIPYITSKDQKVIYNGVKWVPDGAPIQLPEPPLLYNSYIRAERLSITPIPNPNQTPIPAAIWMVGSALAVLIVFGRRKLPV